MATAQRCSEGSGQCVSARTCNTNVDCSAASVSDYCYVNGKGCNCVPGPNDAGVTGVCRRRHAPCEPCTTDFECGSGANFSPRGACFSLDAGAEKVCSQLKVAVCPCGTIENTGGYCVPISGACAPAPCGEDIHCPADNTCRPAPTCQCEARCRWNFALGKEDAPGCPTGEVCWVDSSNLAAPSAFYGYGRCRPPCTQTTDCDVASTLNPFGGSGLKCATESLPDGGVSLARCRGNGVCTDDAECALPVGSAARGYCNRATYLCGTDCRLATNPVTTLPFDDCNTPNTCQAGVCAP